MALNKQHPDVLTFFSFLINSYNNLMQSGPKPMLVEAGRTPQDALACLGRTVKELITRDKCRLYDILIIHGGVIPRNVIYKELAGLIDKDSIWDLNHKNSEVDREEAIRKMYMPMDFLLNVLAGVLVVLIARRLDRR